MAFAKGNGPSPGNRGYHKTLKSLRKEPFLKKVGRINKFKAMAVLVSLLAAGAIGKKGAEYYSISSDLRKAREAYSEKYNERSAEFSKITSEFGMDEDYGLEYIRGLRNRIEKMMNRNPVYKTDDKIINMADWTVLVFDFHSGESMEVSSENGELLKKGVAGTKPFPAADLIKLPIAIAAVNFLDEQYPKGGEDEAKVKLQEGKEISLGEFNALIREMLETEGSDSNSAANRIAFELIGKDEVNRRLKGLGFRAMVKVKIPEKYDWESREEWKEFEKTEIYADDLIEMLKRIPRPGKKKPIGSPYWRELMLDILKIGEERDETIARFMRYGGDKYSLCGRIGDSYGGIGIVKNGEEKFITRKERDYRKEMIKVIEMNNLLSYAQNEGHEIGNELIELAVKMRNVAEEKKPISEYDLRMLTYLSTKDENLANFLLRARVNMMVKYCEKQIEAAEGKEPNSEQKDSLVELENLINQYRNYWEGKDKLKEDELIELNNLYSSIISNLKWAVTLFEKGEEGYKEGAMSLSIAIIQLEMVGSMMNLNEPVYPIRPYSVVILTGNSEVEPWQIRDAIGFVSLEVQKFMSHKLDREIVGQY